MVWTGGRHSSACPEQWAAQVAALDEPPADPRPRRQPLSVARIVEASLALVETDGYDELTMRRLGTALDVSPGALYAHVRDKAGLDDLMLGVVCSRVVLPTPDPARWEAQALDVCRQLRDQYLRYPGIARAALAGAPQSLSTLQINEGLLAVLVSGGIPVRRAAWALDAAFQYIGAYSVVTARRQPGDGDDDPHGGRDEVVERFRMLPAHRFPITVAHAEELVSGENHERFDFTLSTLLGGLVTRGAA